MKTALPALFISHGAPTLILEPGTTRTFLSNLGQSLPRPKAIIAVSAHWTTHQPTVTSTYYPETIHDFGGFPDELYQMTYPAPGSPQLAERVQQALHQQGIAVQQDTQRGLDHGAWVPLKLIYPLADIPVIQISVQPNLSPAHHLAIGKALAPLRTEDVLLLASGSATHNLRDFFGRPIDAEMPAYVEQFNNWLITSILNNDQAALLDYLHQGPHAVQNHPTPEHLLPLFVAMGSGLKPELLHTAATYGVISMAAFAWH